MIPGRGTPGKASPVSPLGLVLHRGHLCVCEVEQILGITQSKASRRLRYPRDAGVLEAEREGLIVDYRLPENQNRELSAILTTLQGLLAGRPVPDVAPLLVQLRAARSVPDPALRTRS